MFRRGTGEVARDPIAEFWQWWSASGADAAANGILAGEFGSLTDEIARKVAAIDPGLQWEFAPGTQARHSLCITAAGVPERRPLAERVFRAAPPPTPVWEYHPARAARTSLTEARLDIGSRRLAGSDVRYEFSLDEERQVLDVVVFHPEFATMAEDERLRVAFLMLDWQLGEDEVERWVGLVDAVTDEPTASRRGDSLSNAVASLAARNHETAWALLVHESASRPVTVISARRPLKWIDSPLRDLHLEVTIGYTARNDAGLPVRAALADLRAAENELVDLLADGALLVAHVTHDGARTFHFYVEGDDTGPLASATAWAQNQSPPARVTATADPGWRAVNDYR